MSEYDKLKYQRRYIRRKLRRWNKRLQENADAIKSIYPLSDEQIEWVQINFVNQVQCDAYFGHLENAHSLDMSIDEQLIFLSRCNSRARQLLDNIQAEQILLEQSDAED